MNVKRYPDQLFVDRLNEALEGVNESLLAKRIGVERKSIYSWKIGATNPSAPQIIKLCAELKITCGWLLGDKETRKNV